MKTQHLKLKDAHLRDLALGKTITITSKMYHPQGLPIHISPAKHSKMETCKTGGRAMKMKLSQAEMKANGIRFLEGGRIRWSDIGRTLKKGVEKAAKFYRDEIRPEVGPALKRLVKKGIEKGIPAVVEGLTTLAGVPEAGIVAEPFVKGYAERISEPVAQYISKTTGAYGTKKKRASPKARKTTKKPKEVSMKAEMYAITEPRGPHPKFELEDNYWNFLGPNHPAFSPTLPPPDNSSPMMTVAIPSGRGLYYQRRGGALGSPMEPLLPPPDNSGLRMNYI